MSPIPDCPWPEALAHPLLTGAEIHVWCLFLDQQAADYALLLSMDESQRAARFRFEREQRRFTVGHGLLRILLGRYLDLPSENLQFTYSATGKPALVAETSLRFNLAHSGELALVAVTMDREIGIDLEFLRPLPEAQELAGKFFSPLERDELAALPPDRKTEAFFGGWTRKEAYLKARGDGLTYPLDQFSVSLAPELPARLLKVAEGTDEMARWSLQSLSPAPGYVGALAVRSLDWQLSQWRMGFP